MPIRALALALLLLPGAASAGLTPKAEKHLDDGLVALYNLDYEQSRGAFRKIIEEEPDNPFGYLFESGAIWWQSAAEFGLFKGTPTLQGLFEQDVEAALRKSKERFNEKDLEVRADAYFVSGMALGTRGQWDLLRGHYLKAYFDGKKAVKHLKKCVKIDKGYHDAYLGLGVFDYQAGLLPGVLKLSFLLGVRGNVKRGLERIQQASQQGRYGARQAAQFLASIYIIDQHDYARALPIIQRLRQDFPESPYFQFLDIYLRHRLGDWDGSFREAAALFDRLRADPAVLKRKMLSLVCGLTADKCLDPQLTRRALPWFEHAIEAAAKEKPDPWSSFLRSVRGQAADVACLRQEAVSDYRAVLAHPDYLGLHARIRRCLEKPCRQADTLDFLRTLSHADVLPPGAPPPSASSGADPSDGDPGDEP